MICLSQHGTLTRHTAYSSLQYCEAACLLDRWVHFDLLTVSLADAICIILLGLRWLMLLSCAGPAALCKNLL